MRALRLAGFYVTLVAAPGEVLTRFAEEEGIDVCALSMRRGIAPVADLVSFVGLCRILLRLGRRSPISSALPKRDCWAM